MPLGADRITAARGVEQDLSGRQRKVALTRVPARRETGGSPREPAPACGAAGCAARVSPSRGRWCITFARALVRVCRSDFACAIAGNHVGTILGTFRRMSAIGLGALARQSSLPAAEEGTAVVTVNRIDTIDDPIDEPARDAIQTAPALGANWTGSARVRRNRRGNAGRGRARTRFGRGADHDRGGSTFKCGTRTDPIRDGLHARRLIARGLTKVTTGK